ncbi:MAG: hypothetical protein GY778_13020, partial [bacterium]|nr:hypothetical protein [bacterium]
MLSRSNRGVGGTGLLVVAVLAATGLMAAPAGASPVLTFVANVQPTPIYQAGPLFEW